MFSWRSRSSSADPRGTGPPPVLGAHENHDAVRAAIRERGYVYLRVVGDSMTPTLVDGDIVRVVPLAAARRGQILAVFALGALVTHRVVTVRGGRVTTRGDNRLLKDPPVSFDRVLGEAVEVFGKGALRRDPLGEIRIAARRFRGIASGALRRALTAAHRRIRRSSGLPFSGGER